MIECERTDWKVQEAQTIVSVMLQKNSLTFVHFKLKYKNLLWCNVNPLTLVLLPWFVSKKKKKLLVQKSKTHLIINSWSVFVSNSVEVALLKFYRLGIFIIHTRFKWPRNHVRRLFLYQQHLSRQGKEITCSKIWRIWEGMELLENEKKKNWTIKKFEMDTWTLKVLISISIPNFL